jgi:hypothetical protein
VDGKNRSTLTNARPALAALLSSRLRKMPNAASLMLFANLLRLSPLTLRSSTKMPWFSATIVLTCLSIQSERECRTFSWTRATLSRARSRFFEPGCLRETGCRGQLPRPGNLDLSDLRDVQAPVVAHPKPVSVIAGRLERASSLESWWPEFRPQGVGPQSRRRNADRRGCSHATPAATAPWRPPPAKRARASASPP